MRAGLLRHRLNILLDTETRDTAGGDVIYTAPSPVTTTVWGSVQATAGNERLAAARTNAETTHMIRIRYWAGLTTRHRFEFGAHRFEILWIDDKDLRHVELVCECKEVV